MRVLCLSHGASPFGAERVLLAVAEGFAARGHDVLVDFPHTGPAVDRAEAMDAVAARITPRRRLPRSALEVPGYLATGPAACLAVRRAIREYAPDLVWVNSMYNPWAAIGARLSGVPVVWHLHEATLREPLGSPMAALIGWAADRIVVVSEFTARGFRQYPWLRDRLVVARNPFLEPPGDGTGAHEDSAGAHGDTARDDGDGPADDEPFTVGYLGQLEPRKRVPDLVAAVARVTGVRALVVGDGKARGAVEAAVRAEGVEDRVELPGFVADIGPALARFDCMAIPSLREPFGLVALEAMAAGVPVVAARSGALPEVLADAALYHEPERPAELARQVRRLRDDIVAPRIVSGRSRFGLHS